MPARTPKVSVLIPTFNAAATLDACLRGVQRQSLPDWECVIVDDGSSDNSATVVAGFTGTDARFRYHRLPHQGLVATLNAGVAQCRGEYVARMDADDLMHRERLAMQVAYLDQHADLVGVGAHVRIFPRDHLHNGWRAYEAWLRSIGDANDVQRELFVESPVVHPTLLIRHSVLAAHPYRDCGWPEDYDLFLRLHQAGARIGMVPRRLLSWRDSALRASRTSRQCGNEVFALCKAHFLARGFLAGGRKYVLWGYGATGRHLWRALAKHDKHLALLVDMHPGRLGNRIHLAPVISPPQLGPPEVLPAPLIVSVAHAGPRQQIRDFLSRRGYQELRHFVCAA